MVDRTSRRRAHGIECSIRFMGLKIKPRMNTNEHEEIFQKDFQQMAQIGISRKDISAKICVICGLFLVRSVRPSEIFSPVRGSSFDQCRAAVRAGVGHRATAQILDQIFQFLAGQRVVGLHRVAADGPWQSCARPVARDSPCVPPPSTRPRDQSRSAEHRPTFTNGGSASSKKVRSPNSPNPTRAA